MLHTAGGPTGAPARSTNERLVLTLVRQHGPLAKAEIARISGLSAQTVSVLMRALEADGLLVKGEPVRGKVGQPSVPMRLAKDGAFFLGLKVGRRSVELVLTDFTGTVRDRALRPHAFPDPAATVAFATEEITRLTDRLPERLRSRVSGLGIAMPFFLWNWARHLGVPEADMAAWRSADIRADLAARFDFPIYLQNDASAACGAEVAFGPKGTPRDFLYFYVGYFIGGGVVLDGRLFPGRGNSGALGPMPVPGPDGTVRQLIDVASLSGLETRLRAEGAQTAHMWTQTDDWSFDGPVLDAWIEGAAAGLAHAILSAVSLIDFEAVLIDGWIPENLRSRLVEAVDRQLDARDFTGLERPETREGTVGPDARALGAASLPLSQGFLVEPG